jgi:hypothetical protein
MEDAKAAAIGLNSGAVSPVFPAVFQYKRVRKTAGINRI